MFVIHEMGGLVWRYIVFLFVGIYHFALVAFFSVLVRMIVYGSPLPSVGRFHSVALLLFSFAITVLLLKKLDIREGEINRLLADPSLKYAYRCYTIGYFVGIVLSVAVIGCLTLLLR